MVGGIPSDYLVSTQLQLWLFCCWGCDCCWAVTIAHLGPKKSKMPPKLHDAAEIEQNSENKSN